MGAHGDAVGLTQLAGSSDNGANLPYSDHGPAQPTCATERQMLTELHLAVAEIPA